MIKDLTGGGFVNYQSIALGGDLFCIGAPVVRWNNSHGLNAYDTSRVVVERENRRTGKIKRRVIKGRRYGGRLLKGPRRPDKVTQIVIHHTGGFTAQRAFETLHNERKLSVQFILADDGTIYQTLDALEVAWHAGRANGRSIGIECCLYPDADRNPGAYSTARQAKFGVASHKISEQRIQGVTREVFQMPEAQVNSLIDLCAGLWVALGREGAPSFPRDEGIVSAVPLRVVPSAGQHEGLLMHMHLSPKKWDPAGLPPDQFEADVGIAWADMAKPHVPPGLSRLLGERP